MGKDTPLHKSSHQGEMSQVCDLVQACEAEEGCTPEKVAAFVNAAGAQERTPLHRACGSNHKDVAIYLVEKGANIGQPDKAGRQPLHWATIGGHTEVGQWLVELGADINAQTSSGMSPLISAAEANNVIAAKFLLDGGADRDIKDKEEKTALEVAQKLGKPGAEMVKLLKSGGAGGEDGDSKACIVM